MLWLIDWLIQEAAKDLVNVEEDVLGAEHGGECMEEAIVGEGEGPAVRDEDLPEEEDEKGGAKAGDGVEEEIGGALMEVPLPEDGSEEKQGTGLYTVSGEMKLSVDEGVGEDT